MKDAKATMYMMPWKQPCSEQVSLLNLLFCLVLEEPAEAQLIICSIYLSILGCFCNVHLRTVLYLSHRTSLLCHKLSSDSWQVLDQEMTGVWDHHGQSCALTQAYKEGSGWTSVQPGTELDGCALRAAGSCSSLR